MPKKSGQTALILVIVTMVTVLGIGVASATQSNIDLRNTVYSTQSEQALACAEAGAERALGQLLDADSTGNGIEDLTGIGGNATLNEGNCSYTSTVKHYPDPSVDGGSVVIPKLAENAVQELSWSSSSTESINIIVSALNTSTQSERASLAVYFYGDDAGFLERRFYFVGSDDANKPSDNFVSENDGQINVSVDPQVKFIRLRPLYTDMSITVKNFKGNTGYFIESTGNAGVVRRMVRAYRYYSQLPSVFDEAIVELGTN